MLKIESLEFNESCLKAIEKHKFGGNKWPVVYIINNDNEAYVGETTDAISRINNHLLNPERANLNMIHLISDEEFNKSATLDIESSLIKYMASDGKYKLQNGNIGLRDHHYYQEQNYHDKFKELWKRLLTNGDLVRNNIQQIDNSDLFKYSPYKSLSDDQYRATREILSSIINKIQNNILSKPIIVEGGAGTGKTVLAIYLMKLLMTKYNFDDYIDNEEISEDMELYKMLGNINSHELSIGLVIPMTSLRKTIRKVFKNISGLNQNMVLGPADVVKKKYDLLIVDEAHRLKRRLNITNYDSFDKTNKKLGLDNKTGTELDWIIKSSKFQVLFYDEGQSIKPSDVRPEKIKELGAERYKLKSQMRIKGGENYLGYVNKIFDCDVRIKESFSNYDFKLFSNIYEFEDAIKNKENKLGLSRIVAGYAWAWRTRDKKYQHDIEITGKKFKWNSTNEDWVNSFAANDEVGCIHTTQGYDLNYTGVIIGPEISYDKISNRITVDIEKYHDRNGSVNIENTQELITYIRNIYRTLMARGIHGTYVYVCDENLREYIKQWIDVVGSEKKTLEISRPVGKNKIVILNNIPESDKYTKCIPLYTLKTAAGKFLENAEVAEAGWVEIPDGSGLKSGEKDYFIVRVSGKSMEPYIPDGSYCVFKHGKDLRGQFRKVLAYHKDIQDKSNSDVDEGERINPGGNFSVKEYHSKKVYEKDGTWKHVEITLKSLNKVYDDIIIKTAEEDEFQILGVFVRVL